MRSNAPGVRRSWHAPTLATTLLLLATPLVARAEDPAPSASDTALARSLGSEGVQLADAGNCAAAIEKLDRAEKLYHAPPLLGRLGECQVQVGKIVAGTENLQRVVRETLPPRAPKAFVDAQARAQKVLDAALPKLAKLQIHVEAPPGTNLTITQDGEPVSQGTLDLDRPADPGVHKIEVSALGFRTARAETTLSEGGSGAVKLRLEPDPSAAAAGPGTVPPVGAPTGAALSTPAGAATDGTTVGAPSTASTPDAGSSGHSNLGAFLLMGTGAVGLGVGTAFGLMTLSKKSSLDDTCTGGKTHCPTTSQGDIDSMRTSSTISTIGFAAGGVLLGAGVVMLIVSKPAAATGRVDGASQHATLVPFVGPGSFGVTGSF